MTDTEESPAPRRSQREKKQVSKFASAKRKRSDATTDEEPDEQTGISDIEPDVGSSDDEEDFHTPKPKTKSPVKRKVKTPVAKGPPPAKKPRAMKATAVKAKAPVQSTNIVKPTVPKVKKATTTRKGRRVVADSEFNAEEMTRDTKISADNPLFNAIMNPSAALQSTVEDFLESLTQTPDQSQAELINCVLRACGCNDTVDADQAVDYDGVVDALDDFTEVLKKDDSPIYPLTSKLPAFKKFRKSLSELLERLISSSAALGSLYTSDLLSTLQTWVVAMSSSQLRSFRHTATVVALEVESALCDVAAAVEKEAEVIGRQREGERKRKAAGKGAATNKAREKDLEGKAAEVRERRTKLAEFLKEFVDGVFVHRYRDLDSHIRAECVRAMGIWFKKHPAHFLDGAYLRYVGWVLSDANTQVRLEAVRALALAYAQSAYVGVGALQHFTERFKPRLVEMAVGDTEVGVRVAVVQVLQMIDGHGLLEDSQREKLCLLVFDEEPRVRKAVGAFVKGVWEEEIEERLVGRRAGEAEKKKAGVKALGTMLVKWGKALDDMEGADEGDEDEDGVDEGPSKRVVKEVAVLVGPQQKGRTALAVEALWEEVEPVRDWETLLDVLLLDHSAVDEEPSAAGRARKGPQSAGGSVVDEAWRLEEGEEGVLLEVLVASLRKAQSEVAGAKKGEDEVVSSNITRALIKDLPQLFVKHQTDPRRMAEVLLIPQIMNLDLYLELRVMTDYNNLWDDVSKQFLSHSSLGLLTNAVTTIRHMMDATSLSKTNSTKILELEDELSSSLRDAIAGRDELEVASFNEDEVLSLGAICARLAALAGIRDMTSWMEEDEGGKQSSAWDIISALSERGRLGYKEEEMMIDQALHLLTLHIIWKARTLSTDPEPSPEEARIRDKLQEQRQPLLDKLVELCIGTQSNTVEGIKRAAFQNLMNLHILFCPAQSIAPDDSRMPTASLALTLDDETQYRCAGFIQAEVERYAEDVVETPSDRNNSESEESDAEPSGDEEQPNAKRGKGSKAKQPAKGSSNQPPSRKQLEKEHVFISTIATFLRAIRTGAVHFRHSTILLTYYGRLGPAFDLCSRVLVDILREEGMYNDNGPIVVEVILKALKDSFQMFLDGDVRTEENTVSLSKLFTQCLIIRGAQLSVVRRLESDHVVDIHIQALSWLVKRITAYEGAKNKKARSKSIAFFKVLLPLLGAIDNRDALKIKAHLDQLVAQAKIEISPSSKIWEPYRAYEKRLTSASTKAPGAKGSKKTTKKGAKSTEMVTTDDDEDNAQADGDAPRPRARPRRASRSTAAATANSETDGEHDVDAEDDDRQSVNPFAAPAEREATPVQRPRPRPQPMYRTRESPAATPARLPSVAASSVGSPDPDVPTRKRRRSEELDESDAGDRGEAEDDATAPASSAASPAPPFASQVSEIQIRKRVRR